MIDYGKFLFAGVPRSGSTWFMKACSEIGLTRGFKSDVHVPFEKESGHLLKVSLVRNPYYWLRSYFREIFPGNTGIPEIDRLQFVGFEATADIATSFENFVGRYLDECPGQVDRIFASYNADTYLRLEDMPWAAVELFESLGIPRDVRILCRRITPQNCSKLFIPKSRNLYLRVMEAEAEMTDRYEYF